MAQSVSPEVVTFDEFPVTGLLPKDSTQASSFRAETQCDGRRARIAVFDTGVDLGCAGLQVTTEGKRKVIEAVDCSGAGDTAMTDAAVAEDGTLTLKSGRKVQVPETWEATEFKTGLKHAADFFPGPLMKRIKDVRADEFKSQREQLRAELLRQKSDENEKEQKTLIDEFDALAQEDFGPVYDVIAWKKNDEWYATLLEYGRDVAEALPPMRNFRVAQESAQLCAQSQLHVALNTYDDGNVVSVVAPNGSHGTHVAGIASAHFPDAADGHLDGVAPGAQVVSCVIGDCRVGTMETVQALSRAMRVAVEMQVDVINLSYGESMAIHSSGFLRDQVRQLSQQHGVLFVSSAGNSGPLLSTIGAPAATCPEMMSIGAFVTPAMLAAEYNLLKHESFEERNMFTWSSRGPNDGGGLGVSVCAPGAAITCVPTYTLSGKQQMNGTSMAAPNFTGCAALLVDFCRRDQATTLAGNTLSAAYERPIVLPNRLKRAIEVTAKSLPQLDEFATGCGLVQVTQAAQHLSKFGADEFDDVELRACVEGDEWRQGVYLRDPVDDEVRVSVSIVPQFHQPSVADDKAQQKRLEFERKLTFVSTDPELCTVAAHALMHSSSRSIQLHVNAGSVAAGTVQQCQVLGYDADDDEETRLQRGPVVRIPVTVVQPTVTPSGTDTLSLGRVHLETNSPHIHRFFLQPPAGATHAVVRLQGIEQTPSTATAAVYADWLQMWPGVRNGDRVFGGRFRANSASAGEKEFCMTMPLRGRRTCELAIASHCTHHANIDISSVSVRWESTQVQFFEAQNNACDGAVALPTAPGKGHIEFTASAAVQRSQNVVPTASLTRLQREFAQSGAPTWTPLSAQRGDVSLDGRHPMTSLTCHFVVPGKWLNTLHSEKALKSVRIRVPALESLLYESALGGASLAAFDGVTQERIAFRDAFFQGDKLEVPTRVAAQSHDLSLSLYLRHSDRSVLEKVHKELRVVLDVALPSSVPVTLFRSQTDALCGSGSKFSQQRLRAGESVDVWTRVESSKLDAIKVAQAGDVLVGALSVNSRREKAPCRGYGSKGVGGVVVPIAVVVPPRASVSDDSNGDKKKKTKATPEKREDHAVDLLTQFTSFLKSAQKKDDSAVKDGSALGGMSEAFLGLLDGEARRLAELQLRFVAADALDSGKDKVTAMHEVVEAARASEEIMRVLALVDDEEFALDETSSVDTKVAQAQAKREKTIVVDALAAAASCVSEQLKQHTGTEDEARALMQQLSDIFRRAGKLGVSAAKDKKFQEAHMRWQVARGRFGAALAAARVANDDDVVQQTLEQLCAQDERWTALRHRQAESRLWTRPSHGFVF